jgi:hypothetical protein
MDLLETISDRMSAHTLPLTAITVAALACPDTPVILTLHWHAFEAEGHDALDAASCPAVPSTAVQVNHRWRDIETLDRAALEAGWELGAWDVARAQHRGCARPGAPGGEALACMQAFGAFPYVVQGRPLALAEAPDAGDLLSVAARDGYLLWMFRPVHGGIWATVADDATLLADGTRVPPCPVDPLPLGDDVSARIIYRFGAPALN